MSSGERSRGLREHGRTYARHRRADPRIAARIHAALGDARTVLNVGAGTGSYEPADRWVLAVEPSATMRAQRPAACRAGDRRARRGAAVRRRLGRRRDGLRHDPPLGAAARPASPSCDASRAGRSSCSPSSSTTLPAWQQRVPARGARARAAAFPAIAEIAAALGGRTRVERIPTPGDCTDGFFEAFWRRPEALLDPEVRGAQSMWPLLEPGVEARIVARLAGRRSSPARGTPSTVTCATRTASMARCGS